MTDLVSHYRAGAMVAGKIDGRILDAMLVGSVIGIASAPGVLGDEWIAAKLKENVAAHAAIRKEVAHV
jgi:hypothetical protein